MDQGWVKIATISSAYPPPARYGFAYAKNYQTKAVGISYKNGQDMGSFQHIIIGIYALGDLR